MAIPELDLFGLLRTVGVDPTAVRAARHTPQEHGLARVLPRLVTERPELFRVYQGLQSEQTEARFRKAKHVISLLPYDGDAAVFAGVYEVAGEKPTTYDEFWSMPENVELGAMGYNGLDHSRIANLFDLKLTEYLAEWIGRLVVRWEPNRAWVRHVRERSNEVVALLPESALVKPLPTWDEVDLTWAELGLLSPSWQMRLSQWRGVYYVFDTRLNLGYVGKAAGAENLLGRWRNYAASGHGGNVLLRQHCQTGDLRFSILELLAESASDDEVNIREMNWKARLHTRAPHGLNAN